MQIEGLILAGTFVSIEQISYGKNHDKAGQPVPNLFKLTVEVGGGSSSRQLDASFFWNKRDEDDPDGEERPSPMAKSLDELELQPGERVAIRVIAKPQKGSSRYVNYSAVRAFRLSAANELRAVS